MFSKKKFKEISDIITPPIEVMNACETMSQAFFKILNATTHMSSNKEK